MNKLLGGAPLSGKEYMRDSIEAALLLSFQRYNINMEEVSRWTGEVMERYIGQASQVVVADSHGLGPASYGMVLSDLVASKISLPEGKDRIDGEVVADCLLEILDMARFECSGSGDLEETVRNHWPHIHS